MNKSTAAVKSIGTEEKRRPWIYLALVAAAFAVMIAGQIGLSANMEIAQVSYQE